jgi:hypothetical protein
MFFPPEYRFSANLFCLSTQGKLKHLIYFLKILLPLLLRRPKGRFNAPFGGEIFFALKRVGTKSALDKKTAALAPRRGTRFSAFR